MPTPQLLPANILVVDDTPENLHLLAGMLANQGYRVRPVLTGRMALQAAAADPPDLVMLDIKMPEIDGFEVCAQLKADARLRDIPVLFISALAEPIDMVRAFAVGGVDYITKPFHFEEVEARVQNHLRLRWLQRDVEARNRQLEAELQARRKLEDLRDNLTHMIVHDMRSPLMVIMGSLDNVMIHKKDAVTARPARKDLDMAREATRQLVEMTHALLDVNRLESQEMPLALAAANVRDLAESAAREIAVLAGAKQIHIAVAGDPVPAVLDQDLVHRVFTNLIGNAIKFSPRKGQIDLFVREVDGYVHAEVTDSGMGIAPEFHARIFDKFTQVAAREAGQKHSVGLGLTFCKLAIEAHAGRIGVRSTPGQGSTFWFEIPQAGPAPRPRQAAVTGSTDAATLPGAAAAGR